MGSISSSVGLLSGIDYQSLVDQLMAIESRPRNLLAKRVSVIDAQKTALMDISARLTSLLGRITALKDRTTFEATKATSSNPDALSVSASSGVLPGSYSFIVRSLASTHQLVSQGFRSREALLSPGTLTLESADARVDAQTRLEALNGYSGVQRGSFKIVDGDGDEAVIRIHDALTVADVVERINAAGLNVKAEITGEGLQLTETNGGTIQVREVGGGHTAADLGFDAAHRNGTGTLAGRDVMFLSGDTPLSALNDNLGVRNTTGGDFIIVDTDGNELTVDLDDILKLDTRLERLNHGNGVELGVIRITLRDGTTRDVDLSGAADIAAVKQRIEEAFADAGDTNPVTVSVTGDGLVISDTSTAPAGNETAALTITDVSGHAARDLGIAGSDTAGKIDGRDVLFMDTLQDALSAINFAVGNNGQVTAAIGADGQHLVIHSNSPGSTGNLQLKLIDGSSSQALFDLGFEEGDYGDVDAVGRRIGAGLDTVLLHTLNGGQGFSGGQFTLSVDGSEVTIDATGAETLDDVIDLINTAAAGAGLNVTASVHAAGTRLIVENSDGGNRTFTISDAAGDTFASDIGLTGSGTSLRSANLQRQYVAETTRLEDLNAGRGVGLGDLKITNAAGAGVTVQFTGKTPETLQDIIAAINEQAGSYGITARVNDTGDGLLVTDSTAGEMHLTIEDDGGTLARDLNIRGTADANEIDGSFEVSLELTGQETLQDLTSRIDAETTLADATIINDGTGVAPYRLSITSKTTGRAGELLIDGADLGFDFATLSQAQDAVVLIGSDPESGVLATSSTNTLTDVVAGLTLNLTGVSDDPVMVTIDRDISGLLTRLSGLATDFNAALSRIDEHGSYDPETETAGLLLGDNTLSLAESRLSRLITGRIPGATGTITRLSQVGFTIEDGELTFDETKFREVFANDPDAVIEFFTAAETGVATVFEESLEGINGTDGLFEHRQETLETQRETLSNRMDALDVLLDRKRTRLERQFQALERALALLQSQQSALSSLEALTSS